MELTKEMLLERQRSLEADAIAINGALQQVSWCLEILESSDGGDAPDETVSEIEED